MMVYFFFSKPGVYQQEYATMLIFRFQLGFMNLPLKVINFF